MWGFRVRPKLNGDAQSNGSGSSFLTKVIFPDGILVVRIGTIHISGALV
jgi:hypothetical protein